MNNVQDHLLLRFPNCLNEIPRVFFFFSLLRINVVSLVVSDVKYFSFSYIQHLKHFLPRAFQKFVFK